MKAFLLTQEIPTSTYGIRPQKSLTDFCIVLPNLFSEVLNVLVKQTTDHHFVVYFLQISKPWLKRKLC